MDVQDRSGAPDSIRGEPVAHLDRAELTDLSCAVTRSPGLMLWQPGRGAQRLSREPLRSTPEENGGAGRVAWEWAWYPAVSGRVRTQWTGSGR